MRVKPWLAGLIAAGAVGAGLEASAAADCTNQPDVYVGSFFRTFSSGSLWTFDVVRRQCEGLVLMNLNYTATGGGPGQRVLAQANLAEVHVPYIAGLNRFRDVTTSSSGFGNISGMGNSEVVPLNSEQCPGTAPNGGSPLFDESRICVRNSDEGLRWKSRAGSKRAESVEITMSSQIDEYNYVNRWTLNDDGSINARLGLTGKLQAVVTDPAYAPKYGSHIGTSSAPRVGAAHQHNIYYRLDFDIGGADGDQVFRKGFSPSTSASPDSGCGTTGQCGKLTSTLIATEAQDVWSSTSSTTWVVADKTLKNADGRNIGYEIVPRITGTWRGMTSTSEPWAGAELWVTKFDPCERLAAANSVPYVPDECDTSASNVKEMLNGQSVDGTDLVVWYADRLLHYPRDEDMERMPIEWMGFDIVPRNLHFQNPSP